MRMRWRALAVVALLGATLTPPASAAFEANLDVHTGGTEAVPGDGHDAHDDHEEAAAFVAPAFNESGGCKDPAGVVTPASTTNSTANRSLPAGHEVRGPWGDFFGRDYGDVSGSMVDWTVPMSGGKTIKVHERALPAFRRAAANLAAEQAKGRSYSVRMAASWVWRRIGGLYRMSTHSFGTSIDINWDRNPFRTDNELITDMPKWFVDAWKDAGFCWGGDWQQIKDAMHFSWKGPSATPGYGPMPGPYAASTSPGDFTDQVFAGVSAWGPLADGFTYDFVDANRDASPDLVRIRSHGDDDVLVEYARSSGDYRYCATARFVVNGAATGTGRRMFADFDGDARPDLWAFDESGGQLRLRVFRHAKSFDKAKVVETAVPVRSGADYLVGDHDRDGRPDLFVVLPGSPLRIEVWSGSSKFTDRIVDATTRLDAGGPSWQFAIGDHDVDGVPDVYAVHLAGSTTLRIIRDNQGYEGAVVERVTPLAADPQGRYRMGDYDGDGRSDLLAVGADGEVTVNLGGVQPGDATFWFKTPDRDCTGFGPTQPWDFNGDRIGDIAVGAPKEDLGDIVDGGVVNVLYGSNAGPRTNDDQIWWQDAPGIVGPSEAGDRFGASIVGGDFDGDGYSDLAVGAPADGVGAVAGAGVVNVIYGSANGLTADGNQLLHQDIPGIPGAAKRNEKFGAALAAGDFNGDGMDDLAIGIPRDRVGGVRMGSVVVLDGSRVGLDVQGATLWNQERQGIRGKGQAGDRFGAALAAGDFDDDGFQDLAVGAPGEDRRGVADAGGVNVVYGSKRGLKPGGDQRIDQAKAGIQGDLGDGDAFGSALAAGDFDADGFVDLAIGAPGDGTGAAAGSGRVAALYGSADGIVAAGDQLLRQGAGGVEGATEQGDGFGAALFAADLDDDGFADLVIGVPGEDIETVADAGAVNVVTGSASGLVGRSGNLWFEGSRLQGTAEKGDRFGDSVYAGDLNGDAYADIVVGIPGEDLAARNAGAFGIIYGSAAGPTPAGNQVWHQDTAGVEGTVEKGDGLGELH